MLAFLPGVTSAQGSIPPTPSQSAPAAPRGSAVLEGNVSAVTSFGDRKVAGTEVSLVSDSVVAKLKPLCRPFDTLAARVLADSAIVASLSDKVSERKQRNAAAGARANAASLDTVLKKLEAASVTARKNQARFDSLDAVGHRVLRAATIAKTQTDTAGHYRLTNVAPGNYLLFAEDMVGYNRSQWFRKVQVIDGSNSAFNLDNTVVTLKPYCIEEHPSKKP
jgi:hypothetical protein